MIGLATHINSLGLIFPGRCVEPFRHFVHLVITSQIYPGRCQNYCGLPRSNLCCRKHEIVELVVNTSPGILPTSRVPTNGNQMKFENFGITGTEILFLQTGGILVMLNAIGTPKLLLNGSVVQLRWSVIG